MGERTFQQRIAIRRSSGEEAAQQATLASGSLRAPERLQVEALLTCTLRERGEQCECRVALTTDDGVLEASGPDFFEAFCGVREQLETRGLVPVCYGASRKVFPSRMSRQRSLGVQAYRLELGRAGRKEDIVEIFQTGDDVEPVSVADQRRFFDEWLRTLGQP